MTGMTFLHGMKPIMIHRDLKSGNVLVDEFRRAKVSDFGTVIAKDKFKNWKELIGTGTKITFVEWEILIDRNGKY